MPGGITQGERDSGALMSTYKGHIAGGIVTYLLIAQAVSLTFPARSHSWYAHVFFIGCAVLGSLFPDIDTRSTIQRLFFIAMIPALPFALFYSMPLFVCLSAVCLGALFIPHRTLTHRPWFIIAISALMAGVVLTTIHTHRHVLVLCCVYFCSGALSHWFLDFGLRRIFPKK
jgi:hypothetical protein